MFVGSLYDCKVDLFAITETWLSVNDSAVCKQRVSSYFTAREDLIVRVAVQPFCLEIIFLFTKSTAQRLNPSNCLSILLLLVLSASD